MTTEFTPERWTTRIEPVGTPPRKPAPTVDLGKFSGMVLRLPELRTACETVLNAMSDRRRGLSYDAVNWGDLSCVSVEVYLDDGGNLGWRVLIEEADPENGPFQIAVTQELEALGFQDVYVETAW